MIRFRFSRTEEKGNAPDARKSDHGIDYSADDATLSSSDPRDYIKLKETDASPVKRADYGKDKRDFVHNHLIFLHSAAPAAKILIFLRMFSRTFSLSKQKNYIHFLKYLLDFYCIIF